MNPKEKTIAIYDLRGAGARLDTVLGRDAALRRPAPRAAAQQAESDIIPRMFRKARRAGVSVETPPPNISSVRRAREIFCGRFYKYAAPNGADAGNNRAHLLGRDAALRRPAPRAAAQQVESECHQHAHTPPRFNPSTLQFTSPE